MGWRQHLAIDLIGPPSDVAIVQDLVLERVECFRKPMKAPKVATSTLRGVPDPLDLESLGADEAMIRADHLQRS